MPEWLDRILGRETRTAAVAPIRDADRRGWRRLRQPWQERAEFFSREMGVVRFASGIGADACARSDLRVEKLVDPATDTWEPTDVPMHAAVLRRYRGKRATQRELIRQHAWHEDTIGEALILMEDGGRSGPVYSVRSPLAAEPQGDGLLIRDVPGGNLRDGTARWLPDERIFRVWIPNETWPGYAESPLHGVMDDCERYWTLGRRMRRTYESALIGNGAVWTPGEAHTKLPRGQREPGAPGQPGTDLERDYYQAAKRAIEDDDSIEAYAPIMWRWPKDDGPPIKVDFMSPLDEHAIEHRAAALGDIGRGLNYPTRLLVDGGGGNHWCASDDTEILTAERGWVTHDALEPGDIVLTLNHESGLSEWQACSAVNRFDVDEDLVSIETAGHSSLTTEAHRWPVLRRHAGAQVRDWTTSADFTRPNNGTSEVENPNRAIVLAARSAELPTAPKYADALVELVAWFWTEGSCDHRSGRLAPRVSIAQSETANPQWCARIAAALTDLFGPQSETLGRGGRAGPGEGNVDGTPRWRIIRKPGTAVLDFRLNTAAGAVLTAVAPDKIVSLDFIHALTSAQLELFIETSVRADGSHMGDSTRLVFQKHPEPLAAVEMAAALAGYATNLRRATYAGFTRHEMWVLRIGSQLVAKPKAQHVSREHYAGVVWCPTTENHTWFARRNGRSFFTGNSDWLLEEQFAKSAVAPKMERICWGDLTEVFLRPTFRALGARGLFDDDPNLYRIGFDMSPVIVHPDQSAQALELYKLGVFGDEDLVETMGFDSTVMPSQEELKRWILRTQIGKERITAQQNPGDSLPSDAANVIESIPSGPPALTAGVGDVIDVASRVRVGPMPGEESSWLA